MSTHHYPCYADVVKEDFVREIAPNEYEDFIDYLENNDSDLDEWASSYGSGQKDIPYTLAECSEETVARWEALKQKFKIATGLVLDITYHNAEGRGDEVNGIVWTVGGVYDYTTAGARYKDSIERKQWVIYG